MPFAAVPFATVLRLNALLFAVLCAGLLLAPGLFASVFGLDPSVGAEVMARRSGAIFAGLAPLYLVLAGVTEPAAQRGIARASLLMMTALPVLGLTELALGRLGPGVLIPVALEVLFIALYLPHAFRRG